MKKHLSLLCAAVFALEAFAVVSAPAIAAPMRVATPDVATNNAGLPITEVRHRRRHGRNHTGAIIGGLAAGAIIGGIIASSRPRYYYDDPYYYAPPRRYYRPRVYYEPRRYYRSSGSAHVRWCLGRYRTYDPGSDTFQPNYGGRRYCNSPYR